MFWKLPSISASSPVESVLDKENFTLEELLDEDEIIQECKALNSRLINFLRERAQVEQLLHYIIDEPPEDAESKRILRFPFIACEVFTCEIDVILKTLVEEDGLMDLLFSFLEPTRSHSAFLAGYFSKVVTCLMLRKTIPLMNYVQSHQNVFSQLVDLIGITSIMEVLLRLVGSDDHMYPNSSDVMQWLAESNLLEMIVDKLSPSSPPEVHANAAETLCTVTRNAPSPLAAKLSSPSQHMHESPVSVNSETVDAMLPKLGDLLTLLNVSADGKVLPTTYGELRPPLGKYRLKIVEFIALLLKTGNEVAEKELVISGTIKRVIDLFFEYPFNNALHHQVESIIFSCLESTNTIILDNLFQECDLVSKILEADRSVTISNEPTRPTLPSTGRQVPRMGNLGHITRISNKLVQLGNTDSRIQMHLQGNSEWNNWQASALQERNMVENVYRWACGRPTALHDRIRDSDDEDVHDRDYDVAALANNLSQAFRYGMYDNDDAENGHGTLDRNDEDTYFGDDSGEVVISSLRLGDDQGSLFTNSNWFAFQDDRIGDSSLSTSHNEILDDIDLNGAANSGGNSSSDDEVVVGEDEELAESINPANTTNLDNVKNNINDITSTDSADMDLKEERPTSFGDPSFFETSGNDDLFGDRPIPEWVGWGESSDFPVSGSSVNPFEDYAKSSVDIASPVDVVPTPVSSTSGGGSLANGISNSSEESIGFELSKRAPSLFEEDVEFVGVELEGTEKAMDQALKEGIVGEAGPLKRNIGPKLREKESSDEKGAELDEFNDANYWKVEQEVAVLE
ncbi:hypothetical protein AgCh_004166 [Apium graveolens]